MTPGARPRVVAIGVGFRAGCPTEALVALVNEAIARLASVVPDVSAKHRVLATLAEKDGPMLREAAEFLGVPVVTLPRTALDGMGNRLSVVSAAARARFGLPSIAEAAALCAAGPAARLVVARIASPAATCAIAMDPAS